MFPHSIQHTINQYYAYYLGTPGFPTMKACADFANRIYRCHSQVFALYDLMVKAQTNSKNPMQKEPTK